MNTHPEDYQVLCANCNIIKACVNQEHYRNTVVYEPLAVPVPKRKSGGQTGSVRGRYKKSNKINPVDPLGSHYMGSKLPEWDRHVDECRELGLDP